MSIKPIEQQVLELRAAGQSIRAISIILDITKASVEKVLKDSNQTSSDSLFETIPDSLKITTDFLK